ncbi:hypothetical protein NE237_004844 [Protea cynaroides]|uniref:Uncharacterized protein n=1 Tax=Protea cynaroides TaxID=273540 RepID=A0A9Q0QTZ5_9MAGN|nr:hypothetical protein NE237_004844 [Protea cynaroides]
MRLPILNGENYAKWLELLELTLGCMNLDLAINEEKPEDLTDESTSDQRDYYAKWQRSNNMSLRLIKANMSRTIRRFIPDKPTAREYLDAIKEQYVSTNSSTVSTLIAKLGAIKYSKSKDVLDHIMKARDIAAQLKDYEIDLLKGFEGAKGLRDPRVFQGYEGAFQGFEGAKGLRVVTLRFSKVLKLRKAQIGMGGYRGSEGGPVLGTAIFRFSEVARLMAPSRAAIQQSNIDSAFAEGGTSRVAMANQANGRPCRKRWRWIYTEKAKSKGSGDEGDTVVQEGGHMPQERWSRVALSMPTGVGGWD